MRKTNEIERRSVETSELQDSADISAPAYPCDKNPTTPAKRNSTPLLLPCLDFGLGYAPTSVVRSIFFLTLVVSVSPAWLYPQALTPAKGEGYVSLIFEDTFVRDHFVSSGDRIDIGHIRTVGLIQSIDYGITDRLGASLSLPIIASKYYGPDPHQLPIDNGNYHGGTQDFRIGVQYNVRRRPVILTPFVTVIVPSRDYIFYAHSAVGTHQPELDLGLAAAGRSERWLPNAYYQVAYSYGIVGVVTRVRPNRSYMNLEGGYFVTRYLALRALAGSQLTQGGFNIPQDFQIADFPHVADERWRHHDQSANINSLNVGGGFDLALGRQWDISAALVTSVWGENGHATRTGLTAGISWSFRTPRARTTQLEMDQPTTSTAPTHTH